MNNFTKVENGLLRTDKLDVYQKSFIINILSNEVGFKISLTALAKRIPCTREKVRRLRKELEDMKLIKVTTVKSDTGTFDANVYEVDIEELNKLLGVDNNIVYLGNNIAYPRQQYSIWVGNDIAQGRQQGSLGVGNKVATKNTNKNTKENTNKNTREKELHPTLENIKIILGEVAYSTWFGNAIIENNKILVDTSLKKMMIEDKYIKKINMNLGIDLEVEVNGKV